MSSSDSSDINLTDNAPQRSLVATILIFSDRTIRACCSSDICPMVVDALEATILCGSLWEEELECTEIDRYGNGEIPCNECATEKTCQFKIEVDDE